MRAAVLVGLAGCSQVLGIEALNGPPSDAAVLTDDGLFDAPDGPPPTTLKLSGTTHKESPGVQLLPGVTVEYLALDSKRIVSTISDGNAAWTLDVPFDGSALTGYLRATINDGKTAITDQYFARDVRADTAQIAVRMVDNDILNQLASICGGGGPTGGTVAVSARDENGGPVMGAALNTKPEGTYCVFDGMQLPRPGNMTGNGGDVFALGVAGPQAMVELAAPVGIPAQPQRMVAVAVGHLAIVPFVFRLAP